MLGNRGGEGLTTSLPQKEHSNLILGLSQHMSSKSDFNSCQLLLKLLFKREKKSINKIPREEKIFFRKFFSFVLKTVEMRKQNYWQ